MEIDGPAQPADDVQLPSKAPDSSAHPNTTTVCSHTGVPVMRRFAQVLEAHQGKNLSLAEVCAKVGVSAHTLQWHCQEHLGMSLHRYLWLRRMNLARRALTSAGPAGATVTAIAADYGFWDLGQFAVAYRTLFGESPSATLRRAPEHGQLADLRGIHCPGLAAID